MDADQVLKLLRKRYDKPGNGGGKRFILLEQVAPATGFSRQATWIDALVIAQWPSDGLLREAFEIKVDRQDFLNEIRSTTKNAWMRSNCHRFWFVTAPKVVNAIDEIPQGDGWLLAQKSRLIVKKEAPFALE